MEITGGITGILTGKVFISVLVVFIICMVSYGIYGMIKNYALLADIKKKKKELEGKLAEVNVKLESIKEKIQSKRGGK